MIVKYFDAHAHISSFDKYYGSIESLLKTCEKEGITKIVDTAIDLKTSIKVLDNFNKFPDLIIPVCGLHPEILIPGSDIYNSKFDGDKDFENFKKFFNKNNIKAIGECGLDYYWLDRNKELNEIQKSEIKQKQVELFTRLIILSNINNLPLVIHSRGAEKECLSIVNLLFYAKASKSKQMTIPKRPKILFHCFTGDIRLAEEILKAGYYISFNGILTYKSGDNIRKILKLAWEKYRDLILVETDSPYLSPIPVKGEICKPYFIKYTIQAVSKIVNIRDQIVSDTVNSNASEFFKI